MTYIIFTLLHNLLEFRQVNLFKRAKHWDSFFTHCTYLLRFSAAPAQSGPLSRAPATASPPGHLQCLSPFIPSLQFLELSALVYKPCNYIQINLRIIGVPLAPFRSVSPRELSAALLRLPECAAHVRGLSKSRISSGGLVRPRLRSSEVRKSVRDRPRSTSLPEQCRRSRNRRTRPRP